MLRMAASCIASAITVTFCAGTLSAAPITVSSYSGPNGGESNSYRDDLYPGGPHATFAALSGGKGDLTDNVSSSNFLDSTWVGWHVWPGNITSPFTAATPLTTTFDLSSAATITSVQIDSYTGTARIFYPSKITLSFSGDGTTFSNSMDYTPPSEASPKYGTLDIAVPSVPAKYVKIVSYHSTYTGESWIFYNNVRFEGTVPEPSTLSLLGLGGLLLLKRRRRT